MPTAMFTLATLLLVFGGTALVARLKGTLGHVARTFRRLLDEPGSTTTWMASFTPALASLGVFFSAALQLAHPGSRWARWFYSDQKLARAHELHD